MEPKYFEINESSAKMAHDLMSFSDYHPGSVTAEYRQQVSAAYAKADKVAAIRPEEAETIYRIAERFSRRLADNYNAASRIGCMCPSVLVAGPANFPVKKKQRQNEAAERNHQEYNEIMNSLRRLDAIARGATIIQSNDPEAIEKLKAKLQRLQELQGTMKEVNAYYRKHKTLDGCTALTPMQFDKLKSAMAADLHTNPVPFAPYQLSNNNANIRRIKERIKTLEAAKAAPEAEPEEYDGFRIVENTDTMRLQIIFEGKPSAEIRAVLKANGFRWAPSQSAWQRQLTSNARFALKRVLNEIEN